MALESLRKRYIFKLLSNIVGFTIGIVLQTIVSRSLGPIAFGDFSFLLATFTQLILFIDFGNSTGFYVKLSQRTFDLRFVSFYIYGTFFLLILLFLFVFVLQFNEKAFGALFPDQKIYYVFCAFILAVVARIIQILTNVLDAFGLTIKSEKGLIAQRLFSLLIIAFLFLYNKLNLTSYFYFQISTNIFLLCLLGVIVKRTGLWKIEVWKISIKRFRVYAYELSKYSFPLFFGFIFGYGGAIFDRWLLQYFSGSLNQGYYGFAYQISTVSTIFGSAMSMLIMREFSIAFKANDIIKMSKLFKRFIPLLFSFAAFISCFTAIHSDKIILLMGGEQYNGAYFTVVIMSFYPIHNTYGQLSGSVFLATGQTRLYSVLSIINVVLGVPLLILLINNSNTIWGLDLGASGLAIKMVVSQILLVNVQLYFNAKLLKLNFFEYLFHQILCILLLLTLSYFSFWIIYELVSIENLIIGFLVSGLFYTFFVALLVFIKPFVFGLSKADITSSYDYVASSFRSFLSRPNR